MPNRYIRNTILFSVVVANLTAPITPPLNAAESGALYNVSHNLMRWYNSHDMAALHSALSPALARKYDLKALDSVIKNCKNSHAEKIDRISLPTMGTRNYAFFVAYIPSSARDMILEINDRKEIVFWTISKDAMGGEFGCSLNGFQ